jgi:ligand-binding sensor domain-containing protein
VYNTSNSGLPDNSAISIAIDGSGNKWIGIYHGGLAKFDGTTWTVYNTSNSGLPNNWVEPIAIDGNGNKWIGTYGGLAKFDGTNWTVYNTSNSGLPDNDVGSIAIDGSGNKWIGTSDGLTKFDGTTWTVYNSSNSGLPGNSIGPIAIDGIGNKWIGTYGGGLAVFNENGISESIKENIMPGKTVKIFPNPAFATITIETPAKGFLSIHSISGQQILQQEIRKPDTTIDVSELASGIYIVRLTSERTVQVGKFIKE